MIQKNTVVDENGQEKFSILLNGKTFNERKEATNFISELLKKSSGSHCPLRGLSGEYKGLHISTIAGDKMATGRDKYAKDTQTEIDDLHNKIKDGVLKGNEDSVHQEVITCKIQSPNENIDVLAARCNVDKSIVSRHLKSFVVEMKKYLE